MDLIDYVYRKMTYLVSRPNAELISKPLIDAKTALARTDEEMLDDQYDDLCRFFCYRGCFTTQNTLSNFDSK